MKCQACVPDRYICFDSACYHCEKRRKLIIPLPEYAVQHHDDYTVIDCCGSCSSFRQGHTEWVYLPFVNKMVTIWNNVGPNYEDKAGKSHLPTWIRIVNGGLHLKGGWLEVTAQQLRFWAQKWCHSSQDKDARLMSMVPVTAFKPFRMSFCTQVSDLGKGLSWKCH